MKAKYLQVFGIATVGFLAIGASLYAAEIDVQEMDARIEKAARESYVFNTYLRSDDVRVDSREGVVTLSGTVNQESHKALAEETVSNLPRVERVDNRLELKGERPVVRSNEWIAMKVNTMLAFRRNVRLDNTEVYVEERVVTLRGKADSEEQKTIITEYVRDIEGVEGVKNEMTVVEPAPEPAQTIQERIDDASITAQVKMVLTSYRSPNAENIKVITRDGVVTLTGMAWNGAEKNLVTRLVSDIRGVNSVVNNMTL